MEVNADLNSILRFNKLPFHPYYLGLLVDNPYLTCSLGSLNSILKVKD